MGPGLIIISTLIVKSFCSHNHHSTEHSHKLSHVIIFKHHLECPVFTNLILMLTPVILWVRNDPHRPPNFNTWSQLDALFQNVYEAQPSWRKYSIQGGLWENKHSNQFQYTPFFPACSWGNEIPAFHSHRSAWHKQVLSSLSCLIFMFF